jgi:hypothetical protein
VKQLQLKLSRNNLALFQNLPARACSILCNSVVKPFIHAGFECFSVRLDPSVADAITE